MSANTLPGDPRLLFSAACKRQPNVTRDASAPAAAAADAQTTDDKPRAVPAAKLGAAAKLAVRAR